jgi:hypothetical protein
MRLLPTIITLCGESRPFNQCCAIRLTVHARGEHIHHSYMKTPSDTKEQGQINLIELLLEVSDLKPGCWTWAADWAARAATWPNIATVGSRVLRLARGKWRWPASSPPPRR